MKKLLLLLLTLMLLTTSVAALALKAVPDDALVTLTTTSKDFTGKTIIPFATSGGSGMGKTNEKLQPSCPGAKLVEGRVCTCSPSPCSRTCI